MRPPENGDSEELEKIRTLQRYFTRLPRAAFLFAESLSYTLRKEINQAILQKAEAAGKNIGLFSFQVNPDGGALDQLKAAKELHPDGLIVENLDEVLDKGGEEWIQYINQLREGLFSLRIPLLFWVSPKTHQVLIRQAMDLYSRRDLASLYFEVPKEVDQADFLDRFPQVSRQQPEFDGDKTRLILLEKQWTQAQSRGLNPERMAEEIGLALLQEYLRHYMLPEAENVWTTCHTELEKLPQAWKVLSEYFEKTGKLEEAIFWQEKEKERAEKLGQDKKVSDALLRLGDLHRVIGKLEKAQAFFEKLQDLTTQWLRENPQNKSLKNYLALSFERLGNLHQALGDLPTALVFFEKYKEVMEELVDAIPSGERFKNNLAISYERLGDLHQALGDLPKALDFFEKRKDLGEQLYQANPRSESLKMGLAISYSRLGGLHQALGDLPKALDFFEKYNALCEELYQANPLSESLKNGLAISYSKLGDLHKALGDLPKALDFFEKYNTLCEQLYQANPNNQGLVRGLAISYWNLASVQEKMENTSEALAWYRKALPLYEKIVAQSHLPEDEKWLGVLKGVIARLEQLPGNL